VNIEDYGAFLEILPGVEGLVHVSEISWASTPINAKEFFKLGEEYEAVVVTLSKDERKMSLSIKQLTEDNAPGSWNYSGVLVVRRGGKRAVTNISGKLGC